MFESKKFGFTILFPKKPINLFPNVESETGLQKFNVSVYEPAKGIMDENYLYRVTCTEYPDSLFSKIDNSTLEIFFEGSKDAMISKTKGVFLSEKVIELSGFPGREIKASLINGTAVIRVRTYLVKNKVYLVETITDIKKDHNKSIDKFFNSFQLQ
ncbi:MAG TPA: hypothetical protein PLJ60_02790 [Chryseolinea sp.]|nr:hypothetical protein [Chryseolinea sp.]HPM29239.1 hypothetical protein [Chryseolinea sp.]